MLRKLGSSLIEMGKVRPETYLSPLKGFFPRLPNVKVNNLFSAKKDSKNVIIVESYLTE